MTNNNSNGSKVPLLTVLLVAFGIIGTMFSVNYAMDINQDEKIACALPRSEFHKEKIVIEARQQQIKEELEARQSELKEDILRAIESLRDDIREQGKKIDRLSTL